MPNYPHTFVEASDGSGLFCQKCGHRLSSAVLVAASASCPFPTHSATPQPPAGPRPPAYPPPRTLGDMGAFASK